MPTSAEEQHREALPTGGAVAFPAAAMLSPPTRWELLRHLRRKHGPLGRVGKRVRLRLRFGFFTPDDYYETVVSRLVTAETCWLDVGCGRDVFPGNRPLAERLAARCAFFQGIDPDETIEENRFVHARARQSLESFETDRTFDLVTMRMVAEHLEAPQHAVSKLARLTRAGGKVVVYTVNRWSPLALAAYVTPFWLHHPVKRFLWGTKERDTFPVCYRMNTRRHLAALFSAGGFRCVFSGQFACCGVFSRFRPLHVLELAAWPLMSVLGGTYPENNLIGVYERTG